MNPFPRHQGVIVPLVTPVTPNGSLDEPAAERLVDHLASNGCGMLVLGTTGEVASLPAALRQRYVEIAVRVAAKRSAPVSGHGLNPWIRSSVITVALRDDERLIGPTPLLSQSVGSGPCQPDRSLRRRGELILAAGGCARSTRASSAGVILPSAANSAIRSSV